MTSPRERTLHPSARGLAEADIARLVDRFYAKVRADAELGPVFAAAVHDWPEHLERLTDFWCSVVLAAGRYKGNPFGAHLRLPIREEHFETWLGLWRRTTEEELAPEHAALFQEKAERIAQSLTAGLFFRPS